MEEDFKEQLSPTDPPQEGDTAMKSEEPRKETWYYHIPSFREEHLRLKAQYENEKRQIKELAEKMNSTKEQIDNDDKAAEPSKKKQKSPKEQMKREKQVNPSLHRKKRK